MSHVHGHVNKLVHSTHERTHARRTQVSEKSRTEFGVKVNADMVTLSSSAALFDAIMLYAHAATKVLLDGGVVTSTSSKCESITARQQCASPCEWVSEKCMGSYLAAKVRAGDLCPCIEANGLQRVSRLGKEYIVATVNGVDYDYPTNFGTQECQSWDLTTPPYCAAASGQPKSDAPVWCSRKWCYVNRAVCDRSKKQSLYFSVKAGLWYSYSKCGDQDYFSLSDILTNGVAMTHAVRITTIEGVAQGIVELDARGDRIELHQVMNCLAGEDGSEYKGMTFKALTSGFQLQEYEGGYKFCSRYSEVAPTIESSVDACKDTCLQRGCWALTYYAGSQTDFYRKCYVFLSATECGSFDSYKDGGGSLWSVPVGVLNGDGQYEAYKQAVVWPGSTMEVPVDYLSTKEVCQKGYMYSEFLARCEICLQGFFTSREGSDYCSTCQDQEDHFSDVIGGTACKKCPQNSKRNLVADAFKSKFGCTCKEDFWAPNLDKSYECEKCPEGGVCDGHTSMPYARGGYWGPAVNTSRPVQHNFSVAEQLSVLQPKHSGSFIRCSTFGDTGCPGGDKSKTANCADGYTGRACTRCSEDYYVFFGQCYECKSSWKKARSVIYAAGLVVGWIIINKFLCEQLDSLDTFLAFAQMANVIGSLGIDWPKGISDFVFRIASVMDFDVLLCTVFAHVHAHVYAHVYTG